MTTLPCSPSNLLSYGPVATSTSLRRRRVKQNRRHSWATHPPTAVFITSLLLTVIQTIPTPVVDLQSDSPGVYSHYPAFTAFSGAAFVVCTRCSCHSVLNCCFFYHVLHHLVLLLNYFLAYKCCQLCLLRWYQYHTLLMFAPKSEDRCSGETECHGAWPRV